MRVAVDTLSITPKSGGTWTYLTHLLPKIVEHDSSNDYVVLAAPYNQMALPSGTGRLSTVVIPLQKTREASGLCSSKRP